MKILVTSAHWKGALTTMRSLSRLGHKITLIASSPAQPNLHSKYCFKRVISPKEEDRGEYARFLLEHITTNDYDLLVPISDLAVETVSEHRDTINPYVHLVLSSKEQIDLALNKDRMYQFCLDNGIPIPKTFFPKNIEDVRKIADEITFPCVIKETRGFGGKGIIYAQSREELISFFEARKNIPWPVVQEFVDGKFCGFTAVCRDGGILGYFAFEVLRQYPEGTGVTVYARSINNPEQFENCARVIKKVGWTGAIDLDYFVTRTNEYFLLEINPRFSGTIQFAYNCGVDLPGCYLALCLNNETLRNYVQKSYPRMFYRAVFPEELYSCLKNKRYFGDFFLNFFRPNCTYDCSFFDPNLLIWQMKHAKWNAGN